MSRGNNAPWAPLSWWIRALYKSTYYYYYFEDKGMFPKARILEDSFLARIPSGLELIFWIGKAWACYATLTSVRLSYYTGILAENLLESVKCYEHAVTQATKLWLNLDAPPHRVCWSVMAGRSSAADSGSGVVRMSISHPGLACCGTGVLEQDT